MRSRPEPATDADVDPERLRGDPPAIVLTYTGSGGGVYHRAMLWDGPRPRCGQHGRNPTLKERAAIESHYRACRRCFPGVDE
ncbi:hypothetical protein ACFQL0_21910 [Haloplanus litoreus]|uniref:hypothetical protein n=1 Tax=Haloplanus litoreus TaxID=767515 RepID=UPI003622454D